MDNNKIAILKLSSFKVESKMHSAIILIDFICGLKNIKLSKTEKYVLAHFMCEGYNQITKEQVVDGKLLKNKNSLANTLTIFRRAGILKRDEFKEVLANDFLIPITDKIKIDVTLDNT